MMLNNLHQRTMLATYLTILAFFLGGYAHVAHSFLASHASTLLVTASMPHGATFCPPLALCLLVLGGGLTALAVTLGKVRLQTVAEYIHRVDETVAKVSSNLTFTRIKSSVSTSSMRLVELAGQRWHGVAEEVTERRTLTISTPEPFLPLDQIARLSLSDVKDLLRYARDSNRLDFRSQEFLSKLSPGARQAAEAMNRVVASSRGIKTALSTPSLLNRCQQDTATDDHAAANMDALSFVAAVRIFAEWRSLRLVPEGYQRYAAAMNLAKRDVIQNVQKIETAAHSWMAHREGSRKSSVDLAKGRQRTSPTIKQLLLWEKEQNIHSRLPRLADKSGASGVLWIFRQLQYQTNVFENITHVPFVFPSAKMAVLAAYETTYSNYHGFLVKTIFQNSFDAAPGADTLLAHMSLSSGDGNDDCHQETATEAMSEDDDYSMIEGSVDLNESSKEGPIRSKKSPLNPFDQVAQLFVKEWMKLERFMSQCTGNHIEEDPCRNLLDTRSINFVENSTALARKSSASTLISRQSAEGEIHSFIGVAEPLLRGLETMIQDLNMNDPSKC